MKYIDLKEKDLASLKDLLKEKQLLIFSLKTKLRLMQVKNTAELREVKKDIARIKMAISSKGSDSKEPSKKLSKESNKEPSKETADA